MSELFSKQSAEYAKYRPGYPQQLYDFIFNYVKNFDLAWDCATGNGQAAIILAERFKQVIATDISEKDSYTHLHHAKRMDFRALYQLHFQNVVCCADLYR